MCWEKDPPFLSDEGDVELVPLELLAGVGHDLVERPLQQIVPANHQPEKQQQQQQQ